MPINITGSWNLTGSFQATTLAGAFPTAPTVGISNLQYFTPFTSSTAQTLYLTASVTSSMSVSASGIHLIVAPADGTGSLNITLYPDSLNAGDVAITPVYSLSGSAVQCARYRTVISSSNGLPYYTSGLGSGAISSVTRNGSYDIINYGNSGNNPSIMLKNSNGTAFMAGLGVSPFPPLTLQAVVGNVGTPL